MKKEKGKEVRVEKFLCVEKNVYTQSIVATHNIIQHSRKCL